MNYDDLALAWPELQTQARERWQDIPEEELAGTFGDRDALVSQIAQRYGYSHDEATHQLDEWVASIRPDGGPGEPPEERMPNETAPEAASTPPGMQPMSDAGADLAPQRTGANQADPTSTFSTRGEARGR